MPKPACLEAALDYLARGWSVVPLCPPDHAGCSEAHVNGCASPGKRPLWPWKEYQSRLPRATELQLFWTRVPTANVGVILGRVSRLVGLDVDGPEAEDLLAELAPGPREPTLEFRTPGGGRRLLYALPPDVVVPRRRWDRGPSHLIVLGEGSYSVMPPSLHPLGGPYQWTPSAAPPNGPSASA